MQNKYITISTDPNTDEVEYFEHFIDAIRHAQNTPLVVEIEIPTFNGETIVLNRNMNTMEFYVRF